MATRVTLPASRFAPMQEARHGQPSVIADVRQKNHEIETDNRCIADACRSTLPRRLNRNWILRFE